MTTMISDHFEQSQFINALRNRLESDAVPTLFNVEHCPRPVKRPLNDQTCDTGISSKYLRIEYNRNVSSAVKAVVASKESIG